MKKLITGIAIATALLGVVSVAGAQTVAFTQNLTIGSTGPEVVALQSWLVAKGYLTIPAGVAQGYFGTLTQSAVAKYQMAKGITPAVGYFGPITRTAVNADQMVVVNPPTGTATPGCPAGAIYNNITGDKCSTSTPTTGNGSSGELRNIDSIGGTDSTVQEGDSDVKVVGVEAEARDSDITIQRVETDFTVGSGGSSRLTNYIDSATLWLDGKALETIDASDIDKDSGMYEFRFDNLKSGVISEGDTGQLYVTVDPVKNVDTDDTDADITVTIPENGIRAIDEAGISDTYVSSPITEQFNVVKADSGDITLSYDSDTNNDRTISADDNSETSNVVLGQFTLKSRSSDNTINSIAFSIATTSATTSVPSDIISNLYLYADGKQIKSKAVPSTANGTPAYVVFDNLDNKIDTINEDDTVDFEVRADIREIDGSFVEGAGVELTATSSGFDIEDSSGDQADISGSFDSGAVTFRSEGITVDSVDTPAPYTNPGASDVPNDGTGEYTIGFKVSAFGEDIYVPLTTAIGSSTTPGAGAFYTIQQNGLDVANAEATSTNTSAVLARTSGGSVDGNFIKISDGQSAVFKLSASYNPTNAGFYRAALNAINFRIASDTGTLTQERTTPVEDFQTDYVNINQ